MLRIRATELGMSQENLRRSSSKGIKSRMERMAVIVTREIKLLLPISPIPNRHALLFFRAGVEKGACS